MISYYILPHQSSPHMPCLFISAYFLVDICMCMCMCWVVAYTVHLLSLPLCVQTLHVHIIVPSWINPSHVMDTTVVNCPFCWLAVSSLRVSCMEACIPRP